MRFAYRRIVVGFHPLAKCGDNEEGMEAKQVVESLHHSFMKYEVVRTGSSLYPIISQMTNLTQNFVILVSMSSRMRISVDRVALAMSNKVA